MNRMNESYCLFGNFVTFYNDLFEINELFVVFDQLHAFFCKFGLKSTSKHSFFVCQAISLKGSTLSAEVSVRVCNSYHSLSMGP